MRKRKERGRGSLPSKTLEREGYIFADKAMVGRINRNGKPWTNRTVCLYNVEQVLYKNNKAHSFKNKKVSEATRSSRWTEIKSAFNDLHDLGFRIIYPHSVSRKHVITLTRYWEARGLMPSSVIQKYSKLCVFLRWINKEHLIESLNRNDLYKEPERFVRKLATEEDKSWREKDINEVLNAIDKQDRHVANQLRISMLFGLRAKESMLFRPIVDFNQKEKIIYVRRGTKNGRPRLIPVETEEQYRFLIELVESCVERNSSLTPRLIPIEKWIKHYYRVLNKFGISRKNGITTHGLRHGYAHNLYEELSGQKATVLNNEPEVNINVSVIEAKIARRIVSERLGHSRVSICSAYLGR